jgi:hypothetical protein
MIGPPGTYNGMVCSSRHIAYPAAHPSRASGQSFEVTMKSVHAIFAMTTLVVGILGLLGRS